MHKRTAQLLAEISAIGPGEHGLLSGFDPQRCKIRHRVLQDVYQGETAFVMTCGPSLGDIWCDGLRDFLSDKLVISVKQAHDLAPDISDFHLYNEVRMQDYDYPASTIRLSVSQYQPTHPSHIHYPIESYTYEQSLFVTNDYTGWDLRKRYTRPWGIGIMFELGLQLPVYLGCSKVAILAFDMNPKGSYHFYDQNNEDSRYYRVDDEEFKYAKTSSIHYQNWSMQQGVTVRLLSSKSELMIERLNDLEELFLF